MLDKIRKQITLGFTVHGPYLKEALYGVIHMADFHSKRHFGPKPPDYVMNKLTIHRVLELFCKRV